MNVIFGITLIENNLFYCEFSKIFAIFVKCNF